jgi:transcriptional regulator with XRE-family HTH domain
MISSVYNDGMAKTKRLTVTDELKKAIEESGLTRYAICQRSGVTEAAMSRFMNGQRGLTLRSLDRLAALLNLHLRKGK